MAHATKLRTGAILGLLAASLLIPSVVAATEVPVYDGEVVYSKANAVCLADGVQNGNTFKMTVRIKVRPSSNAGGGIIFGPGPKAHNYMLDDGVPLKAGTSKGIFNATSFSSQVGVGSYKAPYRMTITPSIVTNATQTIRLVAVIDHFVGTEGCTATITFVGKKR